jgi:hypothetical protein
MYHPIQEDYTKKVRRQLVFVLFRESESGSSSKIRSMQTAKPRSIRAAGGWTGSVINNDIVIQTKKLVHCHRSSTGVGTPTHDNASKRRRRLLVGKAMQARAM